jgi:hypothetical protein
VSVVERCSFWLWLERLFLGCWSYVANDIGLGSVQQANRQLLNTLVLSLSLYSSNIWVEHPFFFCTLRQQLTKKKINLFFTYQFQSRNSIKRAIGRSLGTF